MYTDTYMYSVLVLSHSQKNKLLQNVGMERCR